MGNGLTEYVIKTGQSILVNPEQSDFLIKSNSIDIQGTECGLAWDSS